MAAATFPIPETALEHHTAVLGKTGAGKTSTAKVIVEHLVGAGARVCILDPLKSDWWGLTSNAAGDAPGLPFHILGGPHGHVPLSSSAGELIGQLVAGASLPLTIVDMAEFEPGGQGRFFTEFASALLKQMRGTVHLVMEEAHLFAPKERAGIGDENLSIHWAKTLATAGRSKGVRLLMATQRTQALHNAMLGSCETMIAHRLTAPADQKPVVDWLKANLSGDLAGEVAASLSSLPTGTAWVCSGEAKVFERVAFPRIATFDNSATPTGELTAIEVRTAKVDVERLKALLGPAAADVAPAGAKHPGRADVDVQAAIVKARQEGFDDGYRLGFSEGERLEWRRHMDARHVQHTAALAEIEHELHKDEIEREKGAKPKAAKVAVVKPTADVATPKADTPARAPAAPPEAGVLGLVQAAARVYPAALTWGQVATIAGRKPRGGHFNSCRRGALNQGLLEERDGLVRATDAGLARAGVERRQGPLAEIWSSTLPQPAAKMFDAIRDRPGVTVVGLATVLQMKPVGGHWNSGMATLKRNALIREDGGRLNLAEGLL